jgi:AraC-like DNA-binding protein
MTIHSLHSSASNLHAAWRGRMAIDIGWGWFQGSIGDNHPHAHHALQIAFADNPISVWTPESEWNSHHGFIIGSNQLHQLAANSINVTLIYVEPDSHAGRLIQKRMAGQPLTGLQHDERHILSSLTSGLESVAFNACIESSMSAHYHQYVPPEPDALISQAIQTIQNRVDGSFQAHELAHQAGLSLSRFQHRFKQHTGMALRPFLRWRRLLLAMAHMQAGYSMSDAAYAAGFSDAAHMSRTMRRHFGISPRDVAALLAT